MTLPRSAAELERTRNQLLRVGTVDAVDADQVTASVLIDGVATAMLPVLQTRAGRDRGYWLPAKDEQVMLFCPDGEPSNGVILGAAYSEQFPPPRKHKEHATVYGDTAVEQYNPDTHHRHIELPDHGVLFLTAPTIVLRCERLLRDPYQRAFSSTPNVRQDVEQPPALQPNWELSDAGSRQYKGDWVVDEGHLTILRGQVALHEGDVLLKDGDLVLLDGAVQAPGEGDD